MPIRRHLPVQRRRRVHFVFDPAARDFGSTVMRGEQLAEIAKRHLGEDFSIDYRPASTDFKQSTIFLTKGAIKSLTPDQLIELHRRGNRLLFDVVDEFPPSTTDDLADAIVASSLTSLERHGFAHPSIETVLVNHHVDPRVRLIASRAAAPESFSVGYFGNVVNAFLTEAIESHVKVVQVDTDQRSGSWLHALEGVALHFAIRRSRGIDDAKPFLKGFTAAAMGANVLVHSSDGEAIKWLGDDYPMIIRGAVDEESVVAGLASARASFGAGSWKDASHVMKNVAVRTSDARIAAELRRLFS